MAMEIRITMIVTTTISSTNVKPRLRRCVLPFCIRCTVGSLVFRLCVNVKHALAPPALGFRIVLRAAQAPFVLARERIFGHVPQKLHLAAIRIVGKVLANDPNGSKMKFLRYMPKDPFTGKYEWGLRSPQDDPKSKSWGGQCVFDVYTKTEDKAPDGTPYAEW